MARSRKKYRVSAKRKEKYKLIVSLYDFHASYEKLNKTKIDKSVYIGISSDFNKILVEEKVIKNRKRIKLPYSLGVLRIAKSKKSRYKLVDFGMSNKYNKIIYHTNLHTNGSTFSFHWEKERGLNNSRLYTFTAVQGMRRFLGKEIKTCASDPFKPDYEALPK